MHLAFYRALCVALAFAIVCQFAVTVGCTQRPTQSVADKEHPSAVFHLLNRPPEFEKEIEDVRVWNQQRVDEVLFIFRNTTQRTLSLPSYGLKPQHNIYQPIITAYEVMAAGSWKNVGGPSCGDYFLEPIKPNQEVRLLVYLDPFRWQKVPDAAIVRVRWGDFISEPFVLGTGRYLRADADKAEGTPGARSGS
jgi:hypothetical protein